MYGPNDYRAYVENLDESIYHYGFKGQKKGKRRYQNPDRSLTEEGKRHYGRLGVGAAAVGLAVGGGLLARASHYRKAGKRALHDMILSGNDGSMQGILNHIKKVSMLISN